MCINDKYYYNFICTNLMLQSTRIQQACQRTTNDLEVKQKQNKSTTWKIFFISRHCETLLNQESFHPTFIKFLLNILCHNTMFNACNSTNTHQHNQSINGNRKEKAVICIKFYIYRRLQRKGYKTGNCTLEKQTKKIELVV